MKEITLTCVFYILCLILRSNFKFTFGIFVKTNINFGQFFV